MPPSHSSGAFGNGSPVVTRAAAMSMLAMLLPIFGKPENNVGSPYGM